MYLVDFDTFSKFIKAKGFTDQVQASPVGSILEFRRDNVLYAKVEIYSFQQFNFLRKFGQNLSKKTLIERRKNRKKVNENKFWIRGEEWQVIDNQSVMKLTI